MTRRPDGGSATKLLARRVALASALAAAVGGATAALASGTAATRLLAAHDDESLLTAAVDLADEVREEVEEEWEEDWEEHGQGADPRTFGVTVAHEGVTDSIYTRALLDELDDVDDLPGVRARLDGPGGFLAGDPALPPLALGQCGDTEVGGAALRVCTVAADSGGLTLAMSSAAAKAREGLLGWSVLVGMLLGAFIGGLASHRAAVWALGPLRSLSARVRDVEVADPRPGVLGPPLEHRELEEVRSSVAQLVAQLGEALASARGFAAEAAHELRTPLASLAGELELLAERASANDVPAVEGARRKVADLVSLVQRLLILAQPDAISLATSDTVDLGDVLEAACATLPEPQRERLRSEVQDDVLVRGDTALLVAMLTNAIDNALKFSSAPVTVVVRRDGARVRVSVTDQGPGIPLEERERVFEPFYRSRAARQSNTLGHGVGLALMMHVARAHGGHVSLLSETDVGTTLEVELPAWTPRALSVEP